jgi:transcriptional regulator with XRE-family HTH domain
MKVIKQRLKKLMKANNLSQRKLSEISGVPQYSICRYVSGERIPNINNLVRLARALNSSPNYLVGFEEDK